MSPKRARYLWPWPPPRRGDIVAVLFVIAVLAFVLVGYLWFPFMGKPLHYLHSDPGWTCVYPPKGEPICVKDVLHPAAPQATPSGADERR